VKKTSKNELGRHLKELRESLEVSQGELAEIAQMDQSLLSRYEREEVSPSWLQVERLLEALGQSPCALFPECSSELEPEENFFSIRYYSGKPKDVSGKDTPTSLLRIHRESLFVKLLHLPPIDDRFIVTRAEDDIMIPDWYPGDYVVIDTGTRLPRRRTCGAEVGPRGKKSHSRRFQPSLLATSICRIEVGPRREYRVHLPGSGKKIFGDGGGLRSTRPPTQGELGIRNSRPTPR
jgi:transcriptional regulator with XRE-family HTH domain